MAGMTDDDLERLLRETFADKEKLVAEKNKLAADKQELVADEDELVEALPEATKRRRPVAPILLAAASVFVVLGGILYGVSRGSADPAPPVASAGVAGGSENASGNASPDADIWAAAITAITQRADEAGPQSAETAQIVRTVVVVDQTATTFSGAERASTVRAFSVAEKNRIADLVAKSAHVRVEWPGPALTYTAKCDRTVARVSVGEVVDKVDHKEVSTAISNCGHTALTYRIEKRGDSWTVTGTVGVIQGSIPVSCPVSGTTPASPRDGC
jgi:hypothetical protein